MKITASRTASLLEILLDAFPESNKTHLKKAIRYGCVSFSGKVLENPAFLLQEGQHVEFKKYQEREAAKGNAPFKILFEDDAVMAVVKPAGILSCGRTTERTRSMFGAVDYYLRQKTRGRERAYTVHRLDREVGGILLFAKSGQAKDGLQEHWPEVRKDYYALVEGVPPKEKGTLQSWLKENARQVVYSLREEQEGAKWAMTHYRVLAYYAGKGKKTGRDDALFSLLQVRLETGRKNQIRVHLSDMGCPIVGDRKYGADAKVKRRVRLYAFAINFPHPLTGERVDLEMPLPENFVYVDNQTEY